jgi:anhydro-N-acetylmuramic acid kinase
MGIMSGSSLDGLDMAFIEFQEVSGKWSYTVKAAACHSYSNEWTEKLRSATLLDALQYQLLHTQYGHYLGEQVNRFIQEHDLQYQVQLIASHGHTTFHIPAQKMTAQLGDGSAIAATTGINVVSDLRAMDIALGGQGAPIVPIGEKLLWPDYNLLLNLGGIANLSFSNEDKYIAFDICPANRVLNMLAHEADKKFDEGGAMARKGSIQNTLLGNLNELDYYKQPYPKSLANDFGTEVLYSMIQDAKYELQDALRTYVEHIAIQISNAIQLAVTDSRRAFGKPTAAEGLPTPSSAEASGGKPNLPAGQAGYRLLITGGGVHNTFLIERLKELISNPDIEIIIPNDELIDYKEAIVMALIGVLRWREENNVISSVTGASRNSIGGAVWMGQEA